MSKFSDSLLESKTDWLNSKPIFYNSKTLSISHNMNDVIDWPNLEFDQEGLYNYLKSGYILFDKTPVKDVYRLPENSEIRKTTEFNQVKLQISNNPDPALKLLDLKSHPVDCIDLLKNKINQDVRAVGDDNGILLPLSGGNDSRIIVSLLEDKSRVLPITFDISLSRRFSYETVLAKAVADKLKVPHYRIELEQYMNRHYQKLNFDNFCLEMPIQASYHIEMYDIALREFGEKNAVFSGSVGDWWSGEKVPLPEVKTFQDVEGLYFNHGISIPLEHITIKADPSYNESFIAPHLNLIKDSYPYKVLFSRRGRMGLASFIMRTAELNFPTHTPFYDVQVAMSQLCLTSDQRIDRRWQSEYFDKVGLNNERLLRDIRPVSYDNSLDIIVGAKCVEDLFELDARIFHGIVSSERIEWINQSIYSLKSLNHRPFEKFSSLFYYSNYVRRNTLGQQTDRLFRAYSEKSRLFKAFSEWTLLAPIQMSIAKRNNLAGI